MRNYNPNARGLRTAIIAIICMAIISKFNLVSRTEHTIASMEAAYDNIQTYHEDRNQ
ncbi:hypothetical protein [Pseudoxanthomonas winnipegensis]|uniref:hypothetical protein n=1 Tax=Pseudoxanthomonas winnipegensis TaxID=2480810 RepID=UPI0013F143EF|nr:hypothetical protein [Pseudoxanthomonas winnipegensis]